MVAVLVAFGAAVFAWSDVSLASDPAALAHVSVQPFGGSVERVRASGPDTALICGPIGRSGNAALNAAMRPIVGRRPCTPQA